jgi:hypothetical protein
VRHEQPSSGCVTYLRQGAVSYKCYGGSTSGSVKLAIKNNQSISYEFSQLIRSSQATAAFDGLRASGWQWEWIWAMGSGVKNGTHISINLGTIRDIGEDVLHINDRAIPIRGVEYVVNENATVGDTIRFTYLYDYAVQVLP